MRSLVVLECQRLDVDPRPLFVPSGILVSPGERYGFVAAGKWKDGWRPPCGPKGWPGWLLQARNRLPGHRFFLLCGTVGEDLAQAFPIGERREWSVPEAVGERSDRQLFLFANDWPSFYHNNRVVPPEQGGPLTVTITRLA